MYQHIYSAGPKLRISFWKRNMFTVFRSKFFWFMQIFTICRVYAEKWPLRKIFWAKQISEITNRKSQLRTWQSPVFTGSLFFCFFGLTLKFQNHARVSPFLFKIQAWCRKSWKYWFEHKQEHAYIYIFIYLFIYFKCTAGNGFCWFEAFYNMFMIYANFHDLPRICSKKAVTSTFSPPTEMWNYKRDK